MTTPDLGGAGYWPVDAAVSVRANRTWWDQAAPDYLAEHGEFLGTARFVWGPEGLDEAEAHLLGEVAGLDVLEVGCGAAQCAHWLAQQGARVLGLDQSLGMLRGAPTARHPAAQRPAAHPGADRPGSVRLLCADARQLPLAEESFDLACSAYGAVPFVADPWTVMAEVHRVLRPGGRWVFAVTHPIRWAFPDDPGERGLTAVRSYFDRTPYVEEDSDGRTRYAEHHRTLGDRIRDLTGAGLVLDDLVEPAWPDHLDRPWGGWSPLRGRLLPGTAIFVTHKP